jgi:hypothetical protein
MRSATPPPSGSSTTTSCPGPSGSAGCPLRPEPYEQTISRRLPLERVPDEEPPLRQPNSRELDEAGGEIKPTGGERMGRPAKEALEQIAGRAADVEEAPRSVDYVGNWPSERFPAPLVPTETGLDALVHAR